MEFKRCPRIKLFPPFFKELGYSPVLTLNHRVSAILLIAEYLDHYHTERAHQGPGERPH